MELDELQGIIRDRLEIENAEFIGEDANGHPSYPFTPDQLSVLENTLTSLLFKEEDA